MVGVSSQSIAWLASSSVRPTVSRRPASMIVFVFETSDNQAARLIAASDGGRSARTRRFALCVSSVSGIAAAALGIDVRDESASEAIDTPRRSERSCGGTVGRTPSVMPLTRGSLVRITKR